jgi:hypothetical protein
MTRAFCYLGLLTGIVGLVGCAPAKADDDAQTGGSGGQPGAGGASGGSGKAGSGGEGEGGDVSSGGGSGGEPASGGNGAAWPPQNPATYVECPTDKPQKVYGGALDAETRLTADETWTKDNVYLVFGPFYVGEDQGPVKLTIEAGTVVCFDYGPPGQDGSSVPPPGQLQISAESSLVVLGSPEEHVSFTSKNGDEQFWAGVNFRAEAANDESTLQYLDFYNGGLSAGTHVLSTYPDVTAPPLDLEHVAFYNIQRLGPENLTSGFTPESLIYVHNYHADTPEEDLFDGYPVLRMHPYGAETLTKEMFTIGDLPSSVRTVQLDHAEGALLDQSFTLHELAPTLRYRNVQNMKIDGPSGATMTLDPGVTLAVNIGLYLGDGGSGKADIVAVGTEEQPIVFTSDAYTRGEEPAPGDYAGIVLQPPNFSATTSKFEWVVFEYGGGTGKDTYYNCHDAVSNVFAPVLFSTALGEDYPGPSITHSKFLHSAGQAVRARNNDSGTLTTIYTDTEHDNTFDDIAVMPEQFPAACP